MVFNSNLNAYLCSSSQSKGIFSLQSAKSGACIVPHGMMIRYPILKVDIKLGFQCFYLLLDSLQLSVRRCIFFIKNAGLLNELAEGSMMFFN